MASLILKRALASRPSREWSDDGYDVLADGVIVGRIFKANASPVGASWMWTLAFGHHEDRIRTHGYAATREPRWRRSRRVGGARTSGARLASPLPLRGKPEPEKFPRYLLITGAVVEPLDHVAE
jgi:hypothetical protein